MKQRPILFKAEMVNAILMGLKWQTRREIKPQPVYVCKKSAEHLGQPAISKAANWDDENFIKCPYGKIGDQLWVRETWNHDCYPYPISDNPIIHYRADYLDDPLGADLELSQDGIRRKWMPSIFMPRKASRILLEITNIRVERLNDISRGDCMAEGCPFPNIAKETDPKAWYMDLWETINGKESVNKNPWVWVIEFQRVDHGTS